MIKLTDPRIVKTIELPSFPGSKIEMYDSLLTRESREVSKVQGDDFGKMIAGLEYLIKSWNFSEDDSDNILPINAENLGKIPAKDLQFLAESIVSEDQKKKAESDTQFSQG